METVLKPELEHVEIPVDGPGGRYTVPSVQLRFEDFPAHLLQMTECFLFGCIWGKQINRGLSSQVGQRQLGAAGIRAMQPFHKRVCGNHVHLREVEHVHAPLLPVCNASWPYVLFTKDAVPLR